MNSYHSRDYSYHSSALRASTGLAAVSSPSFACHDETRPQHEFHEQQQGQIQNQLQYGNHHQYQNDSNYHSTTTTVQSSPQHIHAAAIPQTPDGTFLSKSPYSNVEQAGKDILRSARQKLDARRKARPISVEQKTSPPFAATALEVGQTQSSPSVSDLKRQLWSDDEQLQSTRVVAKSRHSAVAQPPILYPEQTSVQTTESASLSQRSYRSLSPSRVSSGLMNENNGSFDSKLTTSTAPAKTMNPSHGRGGPLFHSKYYAAARAARLRDQKEQEEKSFQSSSPLSSGNPNVSKPPTRQESQLRSHSIRSRSVPRSFSSSNDVSKQPEAAPKHQQGNFRSTSQRSRSLSRTFPPTKKSIVSISGAKQATISSRQSSSPLRNSPRKTRYLSRSFSSTNETTASTRTVDSKQHTNIFSHQASPLSSSKRSSHSMPPRQKSDFTRVPSSSQSFMSTSSPATSVSPSTVSEKEHRLGNSASADSSVPARGRLANMALERGLGSRNERSRSPFVEKRIRSFSQDRSQISSVKSSHEHGLQRLQQPQRTGGNGKETSNKIHETGSSPKLSGGSARGEGSNIAAFWNGKINQVTSSPKGSIESPQKRPKEQKDKESNSTESRPSGLDLMAKLKAVDRANPAQALAQIDFILREEGRKTSFEPILINPNIGNDDDSAGTTISSLTNPDYRDWQHQQQMRANQHTPNQNTPTAISSFRRPRPSSLQNYSTNSLPKEKSSPQIPKFQKQPQTIPSTPLEKLKSRQLAKLANASRDGRPNNYNSTGNDEKKAKDCTASLLPRPSPLPTRRSHPWDGDAPDAESINVSVETKEERTVNADAKVVKHDQNVRTISKLRRENTEVKKESHARPSAMSDEHLDVQSKAGNFTTNQSMSKISAPRITPQQYENARKISDNFDAAWALMPESGFTPSVSVKGVQLGSQSSRSSRTLDLYNSFDNSTNTSKSYHSRSVSIPEDDSEGVNGERFSIEVSLVRPNEVPSKGAGKTKSRKRSFLRSLVRRQNGKKGTTSSTNSDSQNSTGMYSGSQSSSAAQSHSTPSSMPSARSSAVVPPPSIHNQSRQNSPMKEPKSTAPTKPIVRSESIEKFRTASMAKKYSRVMRLYDDD